MLASSGEMIPPCGVPLRLAAVKRRETGKISGHHNWH